MCRTSHPFYCLWEVDVASHEVDKVRDITSFPCVPGYDVASLEIRRVQGFFCVLEDAVDYMKCMTYHPFTMSCHVRTQAFGQGCSPAFGRREAVWDL
jgi:hypothetical protein